MQSWSLIIDIAQMCPGIFKPKEGLANFASKQQALDMKTLNTIYKWHVQYS